MSPSRPAPAVLDDLAGAFEQHGPRLFRYCAGRVGASAAEDVVAETFLVAHERRHRYDPDLGPPAAWLFGIATNLLRRHRRTEVRAFRAYARTGADPLVVEEPADRVAALVDAAALIPRVAGVLAELPRRQREVLLLFAVAELGYAEIAAALGIPVGSVRSALHRARTRVRSALEDDHGSTGA